MIALPGTGHKRNRCAALAPWFDAIGARAEQCPRDALYSLSTLVRERASSTPRVDLLN
jgi:hypothetical protein